MNRPQRGFKLLPHIYPCIYEIHTLSLLDCYYPYCYPYPKFGVAAMKSNPIRDQVETSSGRMPKTWFNL